MNEKLEKFMISACNSILGIGRAPLRTAKVKDYARYVHAYIEAGGQCKEENDKFDNREDRFLREDKAKVLPKLGASPYPHIFVAKQDCRIGKLYGADSIKVVVLPGVNVTTEGHNKLLFIDDPLKGSYTPTLYKDLVKHIKKIEKEKQRSKRPYLPETMKRPIERFRNYLLLTSNSSEISQSIDYHIEKIENKSRKEMLAELRSNTYKINTHIENMTARNEGLELDNSKLTHLFHQCETIIDQDYNSQDNIPLKKSRFAVKKLLEVFELYAPLKELNENLQERLETSFSNAVSILNDVVDRAADNSNKQEDRFESHAAVASEVYNTELSNLRY